MPKSWFSCIILKDWKRISKLHFDFKVSLKNLDLVHFFDKNKSKNFSTQVPYKKIYFMTFSKKNKLFTNCQNVWLRIFWYNLNKCLIRLWFKKYSKVFKLFVKKTVWFFLAFFEFYDKLFLPILSFIFFLYNLFGVAFYSIKCFFLNMIHIFSFAVK